MDDAAKLQMLKADLQLLTAANDLYLGKLLEQAAVAISQEGILLGNDVQSSMVQVQYAAYLFRKRAAPDASMPRFLRYQLNNMIFSQKGAAPDDV